MPLILDEKLLEEYLENKSSFLEILEKFNKSKIELESYPVGDLINKLSNQTKDNILHKDEIKYDKNKNLKLNNFFKIKSEIVDTSLEKDPKIYLERKTINIEQNKSENNKSITTELNDNKAEIKEQISKTEKKGKMKLEDLKVEKKKPNENKSDLSTNISTIGDNKLINTSKKFGKRKSSPAKIDKNKYNSNLLVNFLNKK